MKFYKYNLVASWLMALGILLIVAGAIIGLVLGSVEIPGDHISSPKTIFLWQVAITYWVGFGVSGLFFIGMAEIVELLNRIYLELTTKRENEDVA